MERSAFVADRSIAGSSTNTLLEKDDQEQDDDDEAGGGDVDHAAVAIVLLHLILQLLPFAPQFRALVAIKGGAVRSDDRLKTFLDGEHTLLVLQRQLGQAFRVDVYFLLAQGFAGCSWGRLCGRSTDHDDGGECQ